MTAPTDEKSPQLGLLDLSVDLSVPEVYSGTDFTLYLHIKNPFALPVWVQSVELSLPTQMQWRSPDGDSKRLRRSASSGSGSKSLTRAIERRNKLIEKLRKVLNDVPDSENADVRRVDLRSAIEQLVAENYRDSELLAGDSNAKLSARHSATINLHGPQMRNLHLEARDSATINLYDMRPVEEPERVPLIGSLPRNAALEPGCTDVWTIRLGTGKSPFFLPAKYHLQLTVIYSVDRPENDVQREADAGRENDVPLRRIFSNTTSFTTPVKAALWNVMLGSVIGGTIGSVGRSLRDAQTLGSLLDPINLGPAIGALILAIILSGAAIIFSARKSDAQSFVTVEDFWGGLLIGFLIGYSGTAAFSEITRVKV
ncbi:hypothetical protein [Streptomyces sp. NPDC058614]|uniref:hypothetical protein n=1 Tax=Streptomyces sp. NPDC058614 TaxID=3346557 RepID=UPI00366868DC